MTKEQWAEILANTTTPKEKEEALLMLSDEDWLNERAREFLREERDYELHPHYKQRASWPHWRVEFPEASFIGDSDSCRSVKNWIIDNLGRVNTEDKPDPEGSYSVYYDSEYLAWLALLEAICKE